MKGDIVVSEGIEFEVVWDGRDDLIGYRPSNPPDSWAPPPRPYHFKNSEYWSNLRDIRAEARAAKAARGDAPEKELDKASETLEDIKLIDVINDD